MALTHEYEIYEGSGPVITIPFIRTLHNVFGQQEIIKEPDRAGFDRPLESPPYSDFDRDLWKAGTGPYRKKSALPKVVTKSVLEALFLLASANVTHTNQLNRLSRSLWLYWQD